MLRLELDGVSKRHDAEHHIYPMSLALQPGAINVLLGPTRAGKTSLMRLMAGLDKPSTGRVLVNGKDVTGVPVRKRDLAMVYQQFINYPAMTVFENIASPLRLRRLPEAEIRKRVHDIAERLHITPFLERRPSELSGGQQQRTAMARALVKEAGLLLLDEPLVNLDYKLREELRNELTALFSSGKTTVVYATTEPLEALQLGGYVSVLHEGRLLHHGRTLEVFEAPACIKTARTFSDPPINLMPAQITAGGMAQLSQDHAIALSPAQQHRLNGQREVMLGLRAHCLSLGAPSAQAHAMQMTVELSEISGSETYLHMRDGQLGQPGQRHHLNLIAQLPGVHDLEIGSQCQIHFRPADLLVFSKQGELLFAPTR